MVALGICITNFPFRGQCEQVGTGPGEGFNINIGWNIPVSVVMHDCSALMIVIVMMGISPCAAVGVTIMRMVMRNTYETIKKLSRQHWETVGDREYMLAWDKVLLPIARQWQPDIVIVSAGFDAVRAPVALGLGLGLGLGKGD